MRSLFTRLFRSREVVTTTKISQRETLEIPPNPALELMVQSVVERLDKAISGITINIDPDAINPKLCIDGLIEAKVELIFPDETAHISGVWVDRCHREKGFCRHFVQQLHEALDEIGFKRMTARAVLDGKITWAALGFLPTPGDWQSQMQALNEAFQEKRGAYSYESRQLINYLFKENDKNVFPILANLQPRKKTRMIFSSIPDWDGELEIDKTANEVFLFKEIIHE